MKKINIYVEPLWVAGELDLYVIRDAISRSKVRSFISNKRKAFIKKLENEGFIVTYDKKDITEDTICLIMDDTSVCDSSLSDDEYKRRLDQKIFTSAGENFNYPFSLPIDKYLKNPFFPAVFKNESTNGGIDKFLIENNDQFRKVKMFYEQSYDNPIYKLALDTTILQQYLETPSKYQTYLRVLVGGYGEIMGASLKYSARVEKTNKEKGLFEKVFLNQNSEYFIDAKKMFNYYSGGENIYFNQPKYSYEKSKVLTEHGFDINKLNLPNEVLDVCKNIMINCNREIGVLCGIDFMLNKLDEKWYYLESQAFPAIEEWAQQRRVTLPTTNSIKGYMKYLELELQPRYEALMLLVDKKNEDKNRGPVLQKNK